MVFEKTFCSADGYRRVSTAAGAAAANSTTLAGIGWLIGAAFSPPSVMECPLRDQPD